MECAIPVFRAMGKQWASRDATIVSLDGQSVAGMIGMGEMEDAVITLDCATARMWTGFRQPLPVQQFLDHLADHAHAHIGGAGLIYQAMSHHRPDAALALIEKGLNVNEPGEGGALKTTPLMLAAREGYTDVVKALLQHKADVSAVRPVDDSTAANVGRLGRQRRDLAFAARGRRRCRKGRCARLHAVAPRLHARACRRGEGAAGGGGRSLCAKH